MLVQILQLWSGEEVQTRLVQRFPGGDSEGLRVWSVVWTGEVLGLHEILQVNTLFLLADTKLN